MVGSGEFQYVDPDLVKQLKFQDPKDTNKLAKEAQQDMKGVREEG